MLLEIESLEVYYGKKRAVHGVSLHVGSQEIVALLGHNGAGKSTLLKALCGAVRAGRGIIRFKGQNIANRKPAVNLKEGIVYCPQGGEAFTELTVTEQLELGGYILSSKDEVKRSIERVFDLFPLLYERRQLKAKVLSGGERQMLALGTSLMVSPRLLLLDEPSGGLAPIVVEKLFESIKRINQEYEAAILLVEQKLGEAMDLANRAYVMENGQVIYSGDPRHDHERKQVYQILLGTRV